MIRRGLARQATPIAQALQLAEKKNKEYYAAYTQRFFSTQNIYHQPPSLPILEEMAQCVKAQGFPSLNDTAIIGVQHILPTTASLFDVIINQFGMDPADIFLTGKFYSSCPPVESYMRRRGIQLMRNKIPKRPGQFEELMYDTVSDMWEQLAEHLRKNKKSKVIIFDEGAHCLDSIPKWLSFECAFASLEQTRFGLYAPTVGTQLFPLTDVARSAAKKRLESPVISKAIIRRVKEILPKLSISSHTVFGVIGNGAIGSAIVEHLLSLGYKVVIYDGNENAFHNIHHHNCFRVDNVSTVIARSNVVFGTTGRDISEGLDIRGLVKNDITLISTSSQDIEFQALLKEADRTRFTKTEEGALSYLDFPSGSGAQITILESGFPVNFDRTAASDPTDDMELTRGLLLGAFIQSVTVAQKPVDDGTTLNKGSYLMLDPLIQQFVALRWLKRQPQDRQIKEKIGCFENLEWITSNSSGIYEENPLLSKSFSPGIAKEPQSRPVLR